MSECVWRVGVDRKERERERVEGGWGRGERDREGEERQSGRQSRERGWCYKRPRTDRGTD